MDIPKLYKYRYFNENQVSRDGFPGGEIITQWHQVLYDGLIFPASPKTFNDPFDCEFVLDDSIINSLFMKETLIKFLKKQYTVSKGDKDLLRSSDDPEKTFKEILWRKYRIKYKSDRDGINKEISTAMQEIKDSLRIACFSADNLSILMWSHYAQNHQGFCIEYDLNNSEYAAYIKPVQYTHDRRLVPGNLMDCKEPSPAEIIREAALCKSSVWSYEQEWRLVTPRIDIAFPEYQGHTEFYPLKNYITSVYLGAKSNVKYEKEICEHYRGTQVKVYRMQMMSNSYSLETEQIQ